MLQLKEVLDLANLRMEMHENFRAVFLITSASLLGTTLTALAIQSEYASFVGILMNISLLMLLYTKHGKETNTRYYTRLRRKSIVIGAFICIASLLFFQLGHELALINLSLASLSVPIGIGLLVANVRYYMVLRNKTI